MLKFAARKGAGLAMNHLEAHITPGVVSVYSPDSADWRRGGSSRALRLPTDRPARLLMLVHGTFSTTVGAFGALGASKR